MRRATAIILIAVGLLILANEFDQWLKLKELERQVLERGVIYEKQRR